MNLKKEIVSRGIAFCLTVALILPVVTDLAAFLFHEGHEHCTETATVHFHEQEPDCSLCDFHLSPVFLLETSSEKHFNSDNFKLVISSYTPVLEEHNPLYFNLRGPPITS